MRRGERGRTYMRQWGGSDGSGSGRQGKKETLISKVGKMDDVQATLVSVLSSHKGRESEMVDGFVLAVVL